MNNFDLMIDNQIKALFPDLMASHEVVNTDAEYQHVVFTITNSKGVKVKTGKVLFPLNTQFYDLEHALYGMVLDSNDAELDLDDYMAKKRMENRDVAMKMHYFSIVAMRDLEKLGLTEDSEKFEELKNIVGA